MYKCLSIFSVGLLITGSISGYAVADPWPVYLYPAAFYSISDSSREASRDYGFQFSVGYQFNHDWGFEGLTEGTKYRLNDGSGYLSQHGASVQAIYNLGQFVPDSQVRPFGILGGGWLRTDAPKSTYDSPIARVGFGVEWQIPKTGFNLRSDAVLRHEFSGESSTDQSSKNFNDYLVSMGINYRFGSAVIPVARTETPPGLDNRFAAPASPSTMTTTDADAGGRSKALPSVPPAAAPAVAPASSQPAQERVSTGTPLPNDQDGDGVDDQHDKCPDTPPGAVVDADGCIVYMKKQ